MEKLRQLQQRFNELVTQLRSAQGEPSPDASRIANIETEIRSLAGQIETERAILITQEGVDPEERSGDAAPASGEESEAETRAAILAYMRTGDREQLRDLTSGTSGIGGDTGGYLIPQEWENKILEKERESFVMRQLANVQMSGLDRQIPVVDDYGESEWIAEGTVYPTSDPSFSAKLMEAWKVGRICKVSEELLQDNAYNLEQWLIDTFGYTNGLAMETAFINGDGSSKPRGLLLDAQTVAAAAPYTAPAVAYDDLLAMFAALKTGYFSRATWLMNVNSLTAIMKLKDTSGRYLYQPFFPKTPTDPIAQILGKPVVLSANMPDIAAGAKPIALGDFKAYRIHDRAGFSIQRLNERYADTGFIGFKGYQRTDGKLLIPEAVKVLAIAAAA
jgi:HK97 family phage major capsid protein